MRTRGRVTPSPIIGSSNQIRGVSEVFYKYDDHYLLETKLSTDGEDCINLVKYLLEAVYLCLADVLSVKVRLDGRAARPVEQATAVADPEGSFYAGARHYTSGALLSLTEIDNN